MKLEALEAAISEKRDEMIRIGMTKGLSNEETIYCSQELDQLLNDYNRLSEYEDRYPMLKFNKLFLALHKQFYEVLSMPYTFFIVNKNNRLH